jgi:hypothetical protein
VGDEPVHRRELGPVEMGTSAAEPGPDLMFDLVGIGINLCSFCGDTRV